ncbi:uncharacterized protein N7515_006323 [Penicillium bovifimosum]|uniref:Uncharacterized protein n=1 Tax=Penicillium bovifimosum TaxID=126998 RepID=A0A9W9GW11_9EURO|nr:uncharacterized protein N7515_006323 [Penicillium bovifimosum]KAJ5130284.1 hypothetical protein N7515_006323 [Penicillium bovifimosum]
MSSALVFQADPPTAAVIPKAIAIIVPTVTIATTAFNAISCLLVKDCSHGTAWTFVDYPFGTLHMVPRFRDL